MGRRMRTNRLRKLGPARPRVPGMCLLPLRSKRCKPGGMAGLRRPYSGALSALRGIRLLLPCALLSACASIPTATLGDATALAKAGQAAAEQMEQNVTISEQSFSLFRQAAAFNDGFNGVPGASEQLIKNVQQIQLNLTQYGNLLRSLGAAYGAMDELARYGATSSLDSTISNLAADTQEFGKQTGRSISIPAGVVKGVQEGGNVLVGYAQTQKTIAASARIDAILVKVIAALADPRVESAMVPIQGELQGVVGQAAFSIYTQGAYSSQAILNALGAPLGFRASANADAIVKGNSHLRAGLSNVVSEMVNSQIVASRNAYTEGLAALSALEKQHRALQAGRPVTLSNVLAEVGRLKALAQVAAPQTAGGAK